MWVYSIWFAFTFVPFAINSISVLLFFFSPSFAVVLPSFWTYSHHDCILRELLLYYIYMLHHYWNLYTNVTKGLTRTKNGKHICSRNRETLCAAALNLKRKTLFVTYIYIVFLLFFFSSCNVFFLFIFCVWVLVGVGTTVWLYLWFCLAISPLCIA